MYTHCDTVMDPLVSGLIKDGIIMKDLFDANNVDKPLVFGWNALRLAAVNGHCECVKHLLDMGADPNGASQMGLTPLHWAAGYGRHEVVLVLLSRGANPKAVTKRGKTPLCQILLRPPGGHVNPYTETVAHMWKAGIL